MAERALRKILVVEDAPDIQKIYRISLERVGGFEVEICGSGAEALRRAPVYLPDLILLDVMLPGMDGPAILERLRQNPQIRALPVIFLTGKAQPREIAHFLELGAIGVITKPFDAMTLPREVEALWRKAHA